MFPGITPRATNAMIVPTSLLLLPYVLASCIVGYWDCMTNNELDNLGFMDRLSICYYQCYQMDPSDDDGYEDVCGYPNQEPLLQYRLLTGSDPGCVITCWPSKGGVYRLGNVHIVQRQFLGLDRRVAKLLRPEVSADVEDAFCDQLRKLGAQWWESESKYSDELFDAIYTGRPSPDKSVLYIGWPASGGVWALSVDVWDAAKEGYGVIYNSLTMEEQCEMIEEFGGTFYQDPKECPYLDLPGNEPTPSLSHPPALSQTPSPPLTSSVL